jgi:cation:H+ antiporter
LVTAICVAIILYGSVGRVTGVVLLILLALYLVGTLYATAGTAQTSQEDSGPQTHLAVAALMMLAGLAVTIFGARFLVSGAVSIASGLGVSEAIIGLTVVAVGTSLPELVTSVIAARKGQVEVALGNIIGSNIFNILGILGATALVKPLVVPPEIANLDIWVMAVATVVLCLFAISGWKISRKEGAVLFAGYAVYLGYLVVTSLG